MDVLEMIQARRSKDETRRDQMRRDFPDTAAAVDQLRAAFGDGVKVLWCKEGEREVGKQTWGAA